MTPILAFGMSEDRHSAGDIDLVLMVPSEPIGAAARGADGEDDLFLSYAAYGSKSPVGPRTYDQTATHWESVERGKNIYDIHELL